MSDAWRREIGPPLWRTPHRRGASSGLPVSAHQRISRDHGCAIRVDHGHATLQLGRDPTAAHRITSLLRRTDALLRVRVTPNRRTGRNPGHRLRLLHHRRRGPRGSRADRRPDRDQVPGADRRANEGGRGQVRRLARRGRGARGRDPGARDRRPHAGRRARRPEGRDRAGVLRGGALGRAREAADDAVQRHGRDRHRAGRHRASRPRRPRPPLEPSPDRRLRGEAGGRPLRDDRLRAQPRHGRARPARQAAARLRHDPGRDQPARPARRRLLRSPRRAHGDGGRGGRPPQGDAGRDRRRPRRAARALRAVGVRAQREGDRRRRPSRRDPGQGPRIRRQPRAGDRRRRRLADAHRRGSLAGWQAGQLRRDRR